MITENDRQTERKKKEGGQTCRIDLYRLATMVLGVVGGVSFALWTVRSDSEPLDSSVICNPIGEQFCKNNQVTIVQRITFLWR
jgi:hypothetical protein